MHSVMNHEFGTRKPPTPNNTNNNNKPLYHQSKPQTQSTHINPSHQYNQQQSKSSIKQLYKNQLDQFMQEKQKQRKVQKQMIEKQKQQYRERVRIGQQNQKLKDLAYKNYYKMLMQSHQHNSQSYISPYELRDKLKQSHIQNAIQQQMQKSQNYDYQKRMRQLEKKNHYKEQLTRQIQERKVFQSAKKNYLTEENDYYRQHTRSPQEIEKYQKDRKKEQMELYKHDLDRLMQEKLAQSRKVNQALNSQPRLKISQDYHNPLVNPIPYNIQNPYILKQMQKMSTQNVRNQNALYSQEPSDRLRNQSSYFARQGNNMLK